MLAERLEKAWRDRKASVPINAVIKFTEEGLVLGAGTVLAPVIGSKRAVLIDDLDARLLTLLSAAHLEPIRPEAIGHLRNAAERWRLGDQPQTLVQLALSRCERLTNPEADAQRLFLADGLMAAGIEPVNVLKALDIDPAACGSLSKAYNPDQPRVLSGNGRTSGQWTIAPGAAHPVISAALSPPDPEVSQSPATDAPPPRALSAVDFGVPAAAATTLGGALSEPGAWIARLSTGELVALGVAALALGSAGALINLAVVTNKSLRNDGVIPGQPPLHYRWYGDERALILSYADASGVQHAIEAELGEDGFFRDQKGRVVGRRLPDGTMIIDRAALFSQVEAKTKEPEACPAAGPDRPHKNGLLFEDFMKKIINPGNPTPTGYGYKFPNPVTGRDVVFDDCQHRSGVLFDYKGPNYLAKLESSSRGFREGFTKNVIDEAERQIQACEGRTIVWIFADAADANKVREIFAKDAKIQGQILIDSYPWYGRAR